MARSWSGADRAFLILALIPQILSFSLLLGALQAGWGYGYGREPKTYIALIDTARVVTNNSSPGLPDSRDSSLFKDFFAIYPLAYCSGSKDNTTGQFAINHCSQPVKQTFDQQHEWKARGVDIASRYGEIDSVPQRIPIVSLVAFIAAGLCVIMGLLSYLWSNLSALTAFVSGITTIAAMVLVVISGSLAQGLSQNVNDYRATDTAIIDTIKGQRVFVFMWGAAVMSGLATFFWILAALGRPGNGGIRQLHRTGEANSGGLKDTIASVPRPLRLLTRRTTDLFAGALKSKRNAKNSAYIELDDSDRQPFFADSYYPSHRTPDRNGVPAPAAGQGDHGHWAGSPLQRERYEGFPEKNMHA